MGKGFKKLGEIRDKEAKAVWNIWINPSYSGNHLGQTASPNPEASGSGKQAHSIQDDSNQLITDAQKGFLFKLLAERGIEGEAAYQHLKDAFDVTSIAHITKPDASRTIDKMLDG